MMNIIQIESITVEELKRMIAEAICSQLKTQSGTIPQDTQLLTRNETAEFLRISLVTLNSWTKQGFIPSYRIGNRIYYKRTEIESGVKATNYYKHRKP